MILDAGLTPAWQQILRFDTFCVGEVNRAAQAVWCGSGKVLNVGLALHHLGAKSRTLTVLGGRPGEAIIEEFAELGIPGWWIRSHVSTRVCTTILDTARGTTTELVENALPLADDDLHEFQQAYFAEAAEAGMVVLSGSLPAGTPASFYADLMQRTAAPVVLDARGPELAHALPHRPLVVKPNREELQRTVGRSIETDHNLQLAMAELNELGAQWVVVTQGSRAVWISGEGRQHRLEPIVVPVVNPIGCGDSLAAGLALALSDGAGIVDAVRCGMGAAAVNIQQLLPCRLDPRRVNELAARIAPF